MEWKIINLETRDSRLVFQIKRSYLWKLIIATLSISPEGGGGGGRIKKRRNYVSTIPSLDRTRIINTRICIQTQLFKKRSALIYTFFFSCSER